MKNLFQFIIKNSSWLVAFVLIAISFYLAFTQNSYQRSVYLTSANSVTGTFYSASNKVNEFLHLGKNNRLLLEKQAQLVEEVEFLKQQIAVLSQDTAILKYDFIVDKESAVQFNFIPAEIQNISFSGPNNFITVNKGSKDGIKPDMGVVSQSGIVGVVHKVSSRFSTVIPIINPNFRLSAKLKNSENTGSLYWDGKNINLAQIGELPKHEIFQKGDTVVTSFSRIFPKDIVIGYVQEQIHSKDDNFNILNIKIASDFHALTGVLIIDDIFAEEREQLENYTE